MDTKWVVEQMEQAHERDDGMVGDCGGWLPLGYGGHDAGDDGEEGMVVAVYVVLAALATLALLGCAFGWWLGAASGFQLVNWG